MLIMNISLVIRDKNLFKLEKKYAMTTVLNLYPGHIQPVVFSKAECCDRNHTLGMEKKSRKLNKELGATWIKFQFFFSQAALETFRWEDEDDYEYKFSVVSMRTSKNVSLQTLYACSVRKTRTSSRPRPPI